MSLNVTSGRWIARTVALAVPVAVLAAPLSGIAHAAKPTRTPAPQLLQKPANPTNDTTGTFSWQVAANTTYSCGLDRAQRAACAGSFHAPSALADGLHTLTIRSQTQGMRASNWSYTWRIDTVAPAVPSVTAPPSPTSATAVSVTFGDSDTSVVRYACSVDSHPAAACSSPFAQDGFAEGSHTLTVSAFDAAGNSVSATTQWIVDRTAPNLPVITAPASPTNATSASIPFTYDPAASSVMCAVDGAAPTPCTSPLSLAGVSEGTHHLTVTAYDAANNAAAASVSWVVDTTPPAAPSIVNGPAGETDDTAPIVQFTDSDPTGVHFSCTVTDVTTSTVVQGPETCASPYVITGATTDQDSFQLRIVPTDGAGNVGPADQTVIWKLNLNVPFSPPAFVAAPASPSNDTTPTFAFVAPDAGQTGGATGFVCSLDGTAYSPCGAADPNAPTSYTVASALSDGPHAFSVETTDGTSVSKPDTWSWAVDTTPPAAPQVVAPDPTAPNPTVTFSSTDSSVSFLCSVDGGPFVACSNPWTPPAGLSDGSHTLVVATVDAAGNQTAAPSVSFTVKNAPSTQPAGGTSSSGDTTAPTVSAFTTPSSLTSAATASFSESVTGLTSSAARIVVTGTTVALPAKVACLSGSAVAACSGTFTAVRITPTAALVPGQRYTVTVSAGAVHDLAGNPSVAAAKAFRAARVLEESNAVVKRAWPITRSRSAFGRSYVREHLAGASASWTFSGRAITWWTVTGPNQGKAGVFVDGVRKAIFNNYSTATKFRVGRVVKGLSNKRHTLRIVVLGVKGAKSATGTFVSIDAFTVGKTRTATPALAATLRSVSSSRFYGGHAVVGDTKGETLALTFRGTGISFYTTRGVNQGKVAAYVDGVLKATYDDYSARTAYKVARTISGLADRVHTLKLVVLGTHHKGAKGSLVTVDRFAVA
jgi:hypothetical protein